jgi:hypothetical protein
MRKGYYIAMRNRTFYQDKNQSLPDAPLTTATRKLEQDGKDFTPAPDEVARNAYFAYQNEGSRPGRDVQHWLKAEADLIAERDRTRIHGFHNKT